MIEKYLCTLGTEFCGHSVSPFRRHLDESHGGAVVPDIIHTLPDREQHFPVSHFNDMQALPHTHLTNGMRMYVRYRVDAAKMHIYNDYKLNTSSTM